MNPENRFRSKIIFTLGAILLLSVISVSGQSTDHLTDEEIELIRFNQEIDKRMEVYLKAIERRLVVIYGAQTLTDKERKNIEKDVENWGELPKGSTSKMLADIEKILDEAIDKIDDVASRDSKSDLFRSGVHTLADGVKPILPRLDTMLDNTKDPRDRAVISSAISYCNDIIEASQKVQKPLTDKKKEKKKRS